VPMAAAGGVVVVAGDVGAAAMRSCQRVRVRMGRDLMLRQWKLQPLRRRLSRVGVSLRLVPIVAGVMVDETVAGVSAVVGIVGGWMRFVSGLLRGATAVRRRMRMSRWTLRLRDRRLSR